jgi:hypothetical protein
MNGVAKTLSAIALCCAVSATALAQQPASSAVPPGSDAPTPSGAPVPTGKPSKATAQSEAGEPRADTSSPANPSEATDRSAAANPAAGSPPPAAATPSSGHPATAARTPADHAAAGSGSGQKSASKADRIDLGTATVTGDREQPKVMYIVPWKKSDIGDLAGKPMNSLVDEILAPVDRDVFKREVVYYHAVQADGSQNGAPPKPAQQGEK